MTNGYALLMASVVNASVLAGAFAQSVTALNPQQLAYRMATLQDPAWQNRHSAFYELMRSARSTAPGYKIASAVASLMRADPASVESIKVGLIALLIRENIFVATTREKLPEEFSDYYANLIGAVSSLRDERAIDGLIGAIHTGNMATAALGSFGRAAFARTASVFASDDEDLRESAMMVFSAMLDHASSPGSSNEALQNDIEQLVLRALADPSPNVRMAAIQAATKLRSSRIVAALQKLATNDSYRASEHGGDASVLPVRRAAMLALDAIARPR